MKDEKSAVIRPMREKMLPSGSRCSGWGYRLAIAICLAGLLIPRPMSADEQRDNKADKESWLELKPYFARLKEGDGPLTKAKFYREGDTLVIRFWCAEPQMSALTAKVTTNDDDNVFNDDSVEMFLMTEKDNYFQLAVNTCGAVWDKYYTIMGATECQTGAKAEVKKETNSFEITVSIPVTNIVSAKSVSPWRINLTRNRHCAPPKEAIGSTTYYTLQGWYHQPDEWLQADLMGKTPVDLASLMPKAVTVPTYDMKNLSQLAPSLDWVRKERLRIMDGWMTDVYGYRLKPDKAGGHSVYKVIDKTKESGFNVIVLYASEIDWRDAACNAFLLDCARSAGLYARLAGLRVFWHGDYLSGPNNELKKDCPKTVNREGKMENKLHCPVQAVLWDERVRKPILRMLDWEKELGVEISCGYWLDVEFNNGVGECYCDSCFEGFLQKKNIRTGRFYLPLGERFKFIADKGLLPAYQEYLQEKLVEVITPLRTEIDRLRGRPDFLFMVYPGHVAGKSSWLIRGIAKGLGRAEAPVILWEDETYYTGCSDAFKQYQEKNISLMRNCLGYEPLYVPSIFYYAWEKSEDKTCQKVRRLFTPDRVEREFYLFLQASAGFIAYDGYVPDEKSWEELLPFFDAFRKASDRLAKEGKVAACASLPPLSKEEEAKLKKAKQALDANIEAYLAKNVKK